MSTTQAVTLLDRTVEVSEISIGDSIDIAEIPERFNEKRISTLIQKITGDSQLSTILTVQERYCLLLTHLEVSNNSLSNDDCGKYITQLGSANRTYQERGMNFSPMLGRHAELLEIQCENVFDWDAGRMACQLSGDFNSLFGIDMQWEPLNADAIENMDAEVLNQHLQNRVAQISALMSGNKYNDLSQFYYNGEAATAHLIDLSIDNDGLNVVGGEGDAPVRFRALSHLSGHADNIAKCITAASGGHDGTWANESV